MANVVEHRKFSCTKLGSNANKFWNVTLYDNGDVKSEFGRQGDVGQVKVWNGAGRSHMDKKIKEKEHKGYHENMVVEGTGSVVNKAKMVSTTELKNIASKQIRSTNPIVSKLIDFLVESNAHQILLATGGKIVYDTSSASFKTTQGVIIPSQVARARDLLSSLSTFVRRSDWGNPQLEYDLNEYLSIVPRDFGRRKMNPMDIIGNSKDIQKENGILDGLDASFAGVQAVQKPTNKVKDDSKIFDVEMEIVSDKSIISYVRNLYQATRKRMHQANSLSVQTVYKIEINNVKSAFEKYGAGLSNIQKLWHGTKASNLLSILKQGLVIPPSNSSHVTGRMFGNGVYFSDISTKALNYATNFWSNNGNTDRTFMFLSEAAMGNTYIPRSSSDGPYPKRGYDSVFAKEGVSGVQNNEMIVYRTDQCNLLYLVEFSQRD
jgi:poly [ADP-ribose] polymerase